MAELQVAESQPQYVEEVEALLGTPFFYDEERSAAVHEDFYSLNPQEFAARSLLYTRALRLVAEDRHEARNAYTNEGNKFNDEWQLTHQQLAKIALRNQGSVHNIVRQLALINNVEGFMAESTDTSLRPHQEEILEEIIKFVQSRPRSAQVFDRNTGQRYERYIAGAAVIAPTGAGKTVIMAKTAVALGIGEAPSAVDKAPLRLLIVVPSQDLVEQFTGKSGDDTFRRFAPNLTVSAYYQYEKSVSGHVVVVTKDKFIDEFRDGRLAGQNFDVVMIDEVHRLTEPRFYDTFQKHWDGLALGFTATPDYHPSKDARNVLPHVIQKGEIIPYIEDGILNNAQLFTFIIEPHDYADKMPGVDLTDPETRRLIGRELLDGAALDFIETQVKEGRRGIMFCDAGRESMHARLLAERLSNIEIVQSCPPNLFKRHVVAEAIGSFRGHENKMVIDAYHRGEVDVLCTTEKGKEGLNSEFNFVVINTPVGSFLKMRQMVGRGTRLSERFPITRYAQFMLAFHRDSEAQLYYTLMQAFDLRHALQGHVIGEEGDWYAQKQDAIGALPLYLQEMCRKIDEKKLSELPIIISRDLEVRVPDGHVALSKIAAECNIRESLAASILHRLNYQYIGKVETRDGKKVFVRYYEGTAAIYFKQNILPVLAEPEMASFPEVSRRLGGISTSSLKTICKKEQIPRRLLMSRDNGKIMRHLTEAEIQSIEGYISKLPICSPGDMRIAALAKELGCKRNHVSEMLQGERQAVPMRISSKSFGVVSFILKKYVDEIRAEFGKVPFAEPDDMILTEIAIAAGVAYSTVLSLANEADIKAGQLRRRKQDNRILLMWPKKAAEAIIATQKKHRSGLPAHLLPLPAINKIVRYKPDTIRKKMRDIAGKPAAFTPNAPRTSCFSWEQIRRMVEASALPVRIDIDYSRLPTSEDDTNPEKIAYAQSIQRQLMPEIKLFNYEEQGG